MSPRLLLTGAGGFVAGSIIAQAPPGWEVHALSRRRAAVERPGLVWHEVDPLDSARLAEAFAAIKPDAVLHTAAIADIDYCERHPEEAQRANVDLTRDLAALCDAAGAKLVLCSTDTVFDGDRGGYREEDEPRPVNLYGRTKVEAERIVAAMNAPWAIARVCLVVGLPVLGEGNSFVAKIIASWRRGAAVAAPDDEIRSPIDVRTLGAALLELATGDATGVYHLAGNDAVTRLDLTRRLAAKLGFPEELVSPSTAAAPGRAPRPRDASLINAKARATLRTPFLGIDATLESALKGSLDPKSD